MPFRNRYLKYALMGQEDDIPAPPEPKSAEELEEEALLREIEEFEYEPMYPIAPKRFKPIHLGPSGDIKTVDPTEYDPGITHVRELMDEANTRIGVINDQINKWKENVDKFDPREGDMQRLMKLIGEAKAELSIEALGHDEAIEKYDKLVRIARARRYPMRLDDVITERKGAKRDDIVLRQIPQISMLIDLIGRDLRRDAGYEDLIWRARVLVWISKVIGAISSRDEEMKVLRNNMMEIATGEPFVLQYLPRSTSTRQYQDLLDTIERERFRTLRGRGLYEGGSFVTKAYQTVANAYRKKNCPGARMLEDGEIHPLCANWMGPGTNIREALKYPSANAADECAKKHDLDYWRASKYYTGAERADYIRRADEDIMKCMAKTNDYPYKQLGMMGIGAKMSAEDMIPQLTKMIMGKDTAANYFGKRQVKGGCFGCAGDTIKCKGVSSGLRVHTVSPFFVSG